MPVGIDSITNRRPSITGGGPAPLETGPADSLACYGVNGGKAGLSYRVSVIDETGKETVHPGMCDTVTVKAGSVVRIVTTGGGGWGDPLRREVDKVVYDLECGLVSEAAAQEKYGVVLKSRGRKWEVDAEATEKLRGSLVASRGPLPMFDRGPYFDEIRKQGVVRHPDNWSDPDAAWKASAVA